MRITNKYNLPEPIIEAVKNDPYSKGKADFSITELIDSPRIAALKARHDHEIEKDASELIWPLLGRAVHSLLEQHGRKLGGLSAKSGLFAEQRIYTSINGWTISGALDLQRRANNRCKIIDYKFTTAKAALVPKLEWEQQQNLYATLVESEYGFGNDSPLATKVDELEIIAIIRDWSKEKINSSYDYPAAPIFPVSIPLWKPLDRYNLLVERLHHHIERKISESFDKELPLCSPEERWMRNEAWALMKKGNRKATKIFYKEIDAENALKSCRLEDYYLDYRPPIPLRCMSYCDVADFCEQWKSEQKSAMKASSEPDDD
jgi:hypothetical protein